MFGQGTTEEYEAAFDAVTDGLAYFDAEDRLRFFNDAFRRMNGLGPTMLEPGQLWEIVVRGWTRHMHGMTSHDAGTLLDAPGSGGTVELARPDGQTLRLIVSPARNDGFTVTITDVTRDIVARQATQDAEALLTRILEACPAPVLMAQTNGEIIYSTPAWVDMFGHQTSVRDIYADPRDRADFLTELLATGEIANFELNMLNATGDVFPGSVSARLAEYRGEDVIVSSTVDLTWRRKSEAELSRQAEVTYQAEKLSALGELLAGVSHELNNPLALVVGQTLMLQEDALPDDVRPRVDMIASAAERCAKIVRTFLAMARQKPAQMQPVDLTEVLDVALDVAGHGLRTMGARIETTLPQGLPMALADIDQIAQVAVNLLVNAEQALSAQGRAAKVSLRAWAEQDRVCFEISDNGPGIPEPIRRRIFEPFFTTKAVGEGTGVGLAFSHRILQSHGGDISLTSAPGAGATFRVRLPIATPDDDDAGPGPAEAATGKQIALIAEDEPDIAAMISDILHRDGWHCVTVPDGVQALSRIEAEHIDIVVSDLRMPRLDGRGLLEAVRVRWPVLADRFAFVTGDAMGPGADSYLREAGVPHLEKPIVPAELRAMARRLITGAEA